MSELKVCQNNPKCHAPSDCSFCDCCEMCCECFEGIVLTTKQRARIDFLEAEIKYLEGRLAKEVKKREECESRYHNLLTGE
jgi:hypothetical protein